MTTRKTKASPVIPLKIAAGFPIVGIGASAGGLAAFEAFFSAMPLGIKPAMAFVLVQHLSPDHKSLLTEIIQRHTMMPVFEVEDGMAVQPNSVYVIPPNHSMTFHGGILQLLKTTKTNRQYLPIDLFFCSLAQDQHELAIGIILSGAGSDGTQGVRAIKGECGMVMAQIPESSEFDSMPNSAIATGLVDYVLTASEMPAKLIDYVIHAFGKLPRLDTHLALRDQDSMSKIFILLRNQTGHDFSQYKPSTINRRIARRMAVHQIESIEGYVNFLQQTPTEVRSLFLDMLIGVTNFFRDPEAFLVLTEQLLLRLFAHKPSGSVIRVWCPGCSTGEEAYSLAIILVERIEALNLNYTVRIFATDLNSLAIAEARTGLYPANISSDVSAERLARFFTVEPNGSAYRIHKDIRDILVFSEHDLIKDPPFSKLDLISCRNLMIYLDSTLQKKLIPLFHYSLNSDGLLFLGSAEGVGEFDDLFGMLDRKSKLYLRKDDTYKKTHTTLELFMPNRTTSDTTIQQSPNKSFPVKSPLRELTEQMLLQHIASSAALVNNKGDIFYLHGRTGMYLEPAAGEVGISNILKMAREGLGSQLSTALHKAASTEEAVYCTSLRVKTNGHFTWVNLCIHPVTSTRMPTLDSSLYLVIFEETSALNPEQKSQTFIDSDTHNPSANSDAQLIEKLRLELQDKDKYILSTQEELESTNEELKSTNEELQSTNEELETSKEELQSVNEELATINAELQSKVDNAAQIYNDMNNLLDGSGIATIFVDYNLRILRFTPLATQIINLIQSDKDRPLNHIVSNLVNYDCLVADIQTVLKTLIPIEIRVQTQNSQWYTLRIQPYRTLNNVIEGAVLTFVNITETVQSEAALANANKLLRLAVVVRDAHDAITVQDLEGHIIAWNPGAVRMYGWSEEEALQMSVGDRIPEALRKGELTKVHKLSLAKTLKPYRSQRIAKNRAVLEVWITATALMNETGQMYAIATTERVDEVQTD
jgi:two-component system CheB/CheR fusion protein